MSRFLAICLNDYLAGATAGLELARRAPKENRNSECGRFLRTLAAAIAHDRQTLVELTERLVIPRSKVKMPAVWVLERSAD